MTIIGEILDEQYGAAISQLKVEMAVTQAGLDHAVNTLKAIGKLPAGSTGNVYTMAAQALKEIDAITATLRKEPKE